MPEAHRLKVLLPLFFTFLRLIVSCAVGVGWNTPHVGRSGWRNSASRCPGRGFRLSLRVLGGGGGEGSVVVSIGWR